MLGWGRVEFEFGLGQYRNHNIANGYIHVWEDFLFRVDLLIYSSERPTATNFCIATSYIHVCED